MRFIPAILAVLATTLAGAEPASLDVYGSLPNLENVVLAPDGKRIAFVRTEEDQRVVAVVSVADGKLVSGARLGELKPRSVQWADDNTLLIVTSITARIMFFTGGRREYFQLTALDLPTKKAISLPKPMSRVNMGNFIIGPPMIRRIDNQTVLFIPGIHITDRTLPALFRYNLATGDQKVAELGTERTQDWFVDDAGRIAARVDYDEDSRTWALYARVDGKMKAIVSDRSDVEIPRILGFGTDGESALLAFPHQGKSVWRQLSLRTGELAAETEITRLLQNPIENPHTRYLIAGARITDSTEFTFLDRQAQTNWEAIVSGYPGARVRLESLSADLSKFVVRIDGGTHGLNYHLVDMTGRKRVIVGGVYDKVGELHETRRVTYTAADGLEIPAYLTLPRGRPSAKLPLIMLPHGGPAVRDTADFDWWAQALATQGYAVLQPNYRGSALGWEHVSKGFGEWGRKMQTDLSDGVRYLTKEGIVDPARVCIVGASYGGYAALAGVTLDPGVYRCAVAVAGLSDMRRFREWVDDKHPYGSNAELRFWDRFMGAKDRRDPVLEQISPVRHLDALNVPVLMIHGKDDTVVPYDQSDLMAKAMRRANKPVELVTLRKEDHWLSRGETRRLMLQSSVAFLRAHNPPD